ncbi:MAG TPA: WYL domain-containing protein, partial [Ktedonobacteraceae bacterium]|nr:WYL domain-containing protein [Ktedonobacteraceae bacterium]
MEPFSGSRLPELEALLRQHPDGLTSSELAEALEVDVSTVRRDLGRLSSTGVEVHKRGRRYHIGFHHATRSLRLTPDEVLALYLACRLLSRQQSDRNPHAESVMQKLADAVHNDAPRFSNYIKEAALLQRSLPLDEGYLAVLETLTQAWSEGRVVHLSYRDQAGSITERNFHPFCIEPYGATNSCYAIGFDELRHAIRTFKLSRILAADLTNEYFDIPSDFNPNRLFSEAWGVVWHDTPPQMVDLHFFGDTARIVQEAFWHPSQRVLAQQNGMCHVTFQVSEPLEMEPWIRQWGASVEVIAPPELRKAIASNIQQLAEQYAEDNTSIPYQSTRGTSLGEKGTVMAGYPEYYQRTIDAYEHGIKLVLGPTGLGKSSSIPDVVHTNPDRKFIYIANRKQLLEEMAARFKPGEYVILRRDLEVVQEVLLTQRAAFEALLIDPRFKPYLEQARQKSRQKSLEIVAIRRACQQIIEMTKEERILPDWLSRYADAQARIVLQAVRWVLQVTRDENEQGKVYTWLVSHPVVEAFFPAIPFRRRPEVRIMLITLHKAYYGFFDGAQMRSLTDLSADKRLIVFLDEFDFLEHDLVTLICRGPQITDPFAFMANFYRAMAHHKLPKADFPLHPNIRKR